MGFLSRMKDAQQEAMANAGAGGGMGGMRMSDMSGQAAYAQTAQKLAQQGVEAPGVVHTIRHTGEKEFGGSEKIEFDVSIPPAASRTRRRSSSRCCPRSSKASPRARRSPSSTTPTRRRWR